MATVVLMPPFDDLYKFLKHFELVESNTYLTIALRPVDGLTDDEAEHLVDTVYDALATLINISKGGH